jgi:predicted nucleotidyltransferase/uncharacterized protein (UPF0332 family)
MTKKNSKKKVSKKTIHAEDKNVQKLLANLPKDAQEKIKKVKGQIDTLKTEILKKFEDYLVGMALLPPPDMGRPPQGMPPGAPEPPQPDKDDVHVLVLMDDSDSKTMSKLQLRDKLIKLIDEMAAKIDCHLKPQVFLLSELWQSCFDQKYDLVRMIAMGHIIFDKGTLAAVKISEIHKSMVMKKFERYIVSYVLAGSVVQGRATSESDIDVFVVIDDTDVKRMTRYELKEKLRAIIITMGIEAGEITGIKNKLNIQVYILTDFWESVKEANPIIFTFLRDGVPLHDSGTFLPWKNLLRMGKIKPSPEAIDMYMHSGDEIINRVTRKLNEIGMEDCFWAILTPSQAALMLYGVPPPTPKETPGLMRDVFVKKEKMLEDKYVKILERTIEVRKDLEHGKLKALSGVAADELVQDAKDYLKRLKGLFEIIRENKEKEKIKQDYENVLSIARDVLQIEGTTYVKDSDIESKFKEVLVDAGKVETKFLSILKDINKFMKEFEKGAIDRAGISKAVKQAKAFSKRLTEYIQMTQGKAIDKCKLHVKHGNSFGEVILLEDKAFIVYDLEAKQKEVSVAKIDKGRITNIKKSSFEELDHALANDKLPEKAFIKESIFEDLKQFFGKDVQILVRR